MGAMRRFLTSCGLPLAALSAAALLAGCSQGTKPDPYKIGALPAADDVTKSKAVGHWVTKSDGTIHFTGTVAPGAAAGLTAALTPATKTVVATVTGGDLAEGLAIGRTLHDRKLGLTIEGACAGPCADYWFPAATTRRTTSGGWLGYAPDLAETDGATAESRAAEAKLYTDSGLDSTKFHAAMDAELRENPGAGVAASPRSGTRPRRWPRCGCRRTWRRRTPRRTRGGRSPCIRTRSSGCPRCPWPRSLRPRLRRRLFRLPGTPDNPAGSRRCSRRGPACAWPSPGLQSPENARRAFQTLAATRRATALASAIASELESTWLT